jgi:Spy/CpxP family protein refolding chaperone
MKFSALLIAPALLSALLVVPCRALAQGAPMPHVAMSCGQAHGHGLNPMRGIRLTPQQRAQIRTIREQFRAAHPCGSHVTAQERNALHQQVLSVLTPAQRMQYQANMSGEEP